MMLKFKHISLAQTFGMSTTERCASSAEAFAFTWRDEQAVSLLSSHNSAGVTHIGSSVNTMGCRKLGANQEAPGRESSFYGCVIVSHTN